MQKNSSTAKKTWTSLAQRPLFSVDQRHVSGVDRYIAEKVSYSNPSSKMKATDGYWLYSLSQLMTRTLQYLFWAHISLFFYCFSIIVHQPAISIKPSQHLTLRLVLAYTFHLPSARVKSVEKKTTSITQANRTRLFYSNPISTSRYTASSKKYNFLERTKGTCSGVAVPIRPFHLFCALFPVVALLFMFQRLVPVITLYTWSCFAKRPSGKLEIWLS